MPANETNGRTDQSCTDPTDADETIATRGDLATGPTEPHHAAGPISAYVEGNWRRRGVTPEDADEWGPFDGYHYKTGCVTARGVHAEVHRPGVDAAVGLSTDGATAEGVASVAYGGGGVDLWFSVTDGPGKHSGATAELTPEAACDLAAALYAAAWERVNWSATDDGTDDTDGRSVDDYADLGDRAAGAEAD